ncbi:unnamed protein product [Caenorhabditis angaria]|uniref:Uncharacterized protein n=1 Tax=Caenorhabditis angaria TaxID=860376 RepID=A0A9P1NBH0_9PELO|nr:unnamed protein product [Caenorhabditis angaria]
MSHAKIFLVLLQIVLLSTCCFALPVFSEVQSQDTNLHRFKRAFDRFDYNGYFGFVQLQDPPEWEKFRENRYLYKRSIPTVNNQ